MNRISLVVLLAAATACAGKQEVPDEHAHEHGGEAAPGSTPLSAELLDPNLGGWAPEWKDVELEITSPTEGETLPADKPVAVQFDLKNYQVAPNGPHIHLIVDNEPYQAVFDVSKPTELTLAPGAHVIRAFPSRPWHESIKSSPDAFQMIRIVVGADDGKWPVDASKPMLTYSRPKGIYEGEMAKKIMLDFYVTGGELGEGEGKYKVVYTVDGRESTTTEWKPIWIEGLAPGEHEFATKLVDQQGNEVENGGLNNTRRTITVK